MVGKHLQKLLPDAFYLSSQDGDLTNATDTKKLIYYYKPDIVVHLAARVGGIQDNINNPVDFLNDNLLMNTNILKYSHEYGVQKFIGILSSCIYPSVVDTYPMREEQLHDGPPFENNMGYGYAKRCLALQIDSYNKQYGTKYNYIIPSNLYSEYDDFENKNKMHFITSLLLKIKNAENNTIELLGDGTALRQFMYADDLARIIKLTIDNDITENFNIGYYENLSINEMAKRALGVLGKEYKINYSHPELKGQLRKDISNEKLLTLFPNFIFTPFEEGIKKVYDTISK